MRNAWRAAPRRKTHSAFRIPHSAFHRAGFTLLEVLLAIAITLLTMSLVGAVLHMQLKVIEGTRGEVEQAQLARALLKHIADDLRNVVKYDPLEVSLPSSAGAAAGVTAAATAASAAAAAGATDAGGGGAGATGTGSSGSSGGSPTGGTGASTGGSQGGSASSPSGSSASPMGNTSGMGSGADSGMPATSSSSSSYGTPGVRGDLDDYGRPRLQIDISRLPRRDQLLAAEQGIGSGGRISDIKTVTYFVDELGLRRYEISRAESVVAAEEGDDTARMSEGAAVLAAEVADIHFEFYDGQQWQEAWPPESADETTPKLPLAVHIILYFKLPGFASDYAGLSSFDLGALPQRRLIVPLPAAELPDESASAATQNSSSSGSNSSSSKSSNSNSSSSKSSNSSNSTGGSNTSGSKASSGSGGSR
jgi:prepilin-type N-terminal cleavage/methylation domain-containing protein